MCATGRGDGMGESWKLRDTGDADEFSPDWNYSFPAPEGGGNAGSGGAGYGGAGQRRSLSSRTSPPPVSKAPPSKPALIASPSPQAAAAVAAAPCARANRWRNKNPRRHPVAAPCPLGWCAAVGCSTALLGVAGVPPRARGLDPARVRSCRPPRTADLTPGPRGSPVRTVE